jgi:hypothetical protein
MRRCTLPVASEAGSAAGMNHVSGRRESMSESKTRKCSERPGICEAAASFTSCCGVWNRKMQHVRREALGRTCSRRGARGHVAQEVYGAQRSGRHGPDT